MIDQLQQNFPMRASGLLPDFLIRQKIKITPFAEGEKRPGKISYGLSSYGYDARLGEKILVFSNARHPTLAIDPKRTDMRSFEEIPSIHDKETGDNYVYIPPNSYILGETVETFEIPRDIMCIVLGKSTYARIAVIPTVTPLEAEWKGKITMEIGNSSPLPAKVYIGEGIVQILFFRTLADCERSYADKCSGQPGKYQNQEGLTLPKVD